MEVSAWAAVAIVAAATVGGAMLTRAFGDSRRAALRVGAAALLVLVAADLLPEVVRDVAGSGSARVPVGAASLAGLFVAAGAARWVCACGSHPTTTTGGAIAVHRALEGAALVLVGSVGVVTALVLHAAAEGFALRSYADRDVRPLLTLACLSPAAGALLFGDFEPPPTVAPVVTSLIAGALAAGAVRMLGAVRQEVPA